MVGILIGLLIKILLVGSCAAITVQGIVLIVSGRYQSQINKLKLEIASLKAKRQQLYHDIEDKFGVMMHEQLIEVANGMEIGDYYKMLSKQDELKQAI